MEFYGRVNGSQKKPHYSRYCTVSGYVISVLSLIRNLQGIEQAASAGFGFSLGLPTLLGSEMG